LVYDGQTEIDDVSRRIGEKERGKREREKRAIIAI
jgi:hypothetical protein